jgi:hypothetical protein
LNELITAAGLTATVVKVRRMAEKNVTEPAALMVAIAPMLVTEVNPAGIGIVVQYGPSGCWAAAPIPMQAKANAAKLPILFMGGIDERDQGRVH